VQPSSIVWIQADANIQDVKVLEQGQRLKADEVSFKGRGGTAFTPAFEHLRDNHPDVQAIVYLTDLESGSEDFETAEQLAVAPTLWVSVDQRAVAPFGETVYLNA
jgi:predicted metal-dependent peptidase